MPAHDHWFNEFKGEITTDHREILERARRPNHNGEWSFNHAVARTRQFYTERFTGYARCNSITLDELKVLLKMIETFATDAFPGS
ncbi:MAG: hypothetical protein ISR45_00765 [Rhodospirillales bacterium]|nr:hypothetical protein [Rhodospirillales bacterium]